MEDCIAAKTPAFIKLAKNVINTSYPTTHKKNDGKIELIY
jgi:hypothetical protein